MVKKIFNFIIKKGIIIYLLLGLFISLHLYLVLKTFVVDDLGNIRTAYSGYGDIPFHMTQVSKFGYGSLFDLNEPLFTGEKIKYSFIVNYISGALLKLTGSWTFAMHAPVFVLMIVSYFLMFVIYNKLLNRRWAALLAVIIFFLGSGMSGYGLVRDKIVEERMALSEFTEYITDNNIFTFVKFNASYPEQNVSWGPPLSVSFLHQRSFFVGLFLFLSLFYLLAFKIKNSAKKSYLILAGIVFGLGPLGHYHTFIVMSVVSGFFLLGALVQKDMHYAKKIFAVGVIAGLIALPQVAYLLSGQNPEIITGDSSLIKYRLGWMTGDGFGSIQYPLGEEPDIFFKILIYLKFLWVNFGIILPLLLVGSFIKGFRSKMALFYLLAGIIFIVNNLFQFQPWDYDNNKLLVYFSFFATPIVISMIIFLAGKLRWYGIPVYALIVAAVIFSGVIDIIPRYKVEIDKMPVIFDIHAVKMADYIRANIQPEEMIITSSTHLNPVSSVAGRPVIVGFPGWLWTKGINYSPREDELKNFYADPVTNIDVADKYNAGYALFELTVSNDWKFQKATLDSDFPIVFSAGQYTLYKIK